MKFIKMSVSTKNILFNLVGGAAWFMACFLFTDKYKSLTIIAAIALLIAGILLVYERISEYLLREDEMYITHMNEAKAAALDRVIYGMMVFCIIATATESLGITDHSKDWRALVFIFVGFAKLFTGMYFRNLEKKGRYY